MCWCCRHTAAGTANGPDPDAGGYVPKQVIAFLNNEHNRSLIRGVIAAGNNNFGAEFAYAGTWSPANAACRTSTALN